MKPRLASWPWMWTLAMVVGAHPAAAGISRFGIDAGLSAARHFGDAGATDHRMGFGGGIAATIPVTASCSLQPELLYVMKGGVVPRIELVDGSGTTIGSMSLTYAVDYIEIPVLARISVPTTGRVAPFFLAGPAVAFKITEALRGSPEEIPDRRDDLASTDIGLAFGAGVELGRERRRWQIEARYTAGVSNALADPVGYRVRNGAFLVTAGLAWYR